MFERHSCRPPPDAPGQHVQPQQNNPTGVMPESGDFWRVLCTLGLVCASLCANEAEYDGNYVDGFDNEISRERQEGEFGLFVFCLCFVCVNRWFCQ